MRLALVLLSLLLAAATQQSMASTPDAALQQVRAMQLVGAGDLRFLGFRIYTASLLAPGGEYRSDTPHALKIDYNRSFSADRLSRTSVDEIERIHGGVENPETLFGQLRAVFPDVEKGDHLLALHLPGRGAWFYQDEQPLGVIDDADVAARFFSIWLDNQTRAPDLRSRLLGEAQ